MSFKWILKSGCTLRNVNLKRYGIERIGLYLIFANTEDKLYKSADSEWIYKS